LAQVALLYLLCLSVSMASFSLALLSCVALVSAEDLRASPSLQLMSGITGPDQCLCAVGDSAALFEPCSEAIAAGDGREVLSFESGGQLRNVVTGKCLEAAGGHVSFGQCGGKSASAWALSEDGQLKLAGTEMCLSQTGSFAGDEDIAHGAPVSATSTAEEGSHGAVKAVDGGEKTYWVSALDADGAQHFTVDFGAQRTLVSAVIEWEFPAMDYSLQVSTDGETWTDAFATDVNGLFTSRIYLGYAHAAKARLVLRKAHPVYGQFHGKKAIGIRRFAVIAPRLEAVVEKCDVAAKSADARDKHFLAYVGNFDPCPSKELRAEVPTLESALASLASASSKLAAKFPALGACGVKSFLSVGRGQLWEDVAHEEFATGSAGSGVSGLVRRMNSLPDGAAAVEAARAVVEKARAAIGA